MLWNQPIISDDLHKERKTKIVAMKQPKRYSIEGFEQICNVVTPENYTNFFTDMLQAFGMYTEAIALMRKEHPELCKGKTNWQICKFHFDWIDDGKNDLKSIRFTTTDTGETIEVKVKQK